MSVKVLSSEGGLVAYQNFTLVIYMNWSGADLTIIYSSNGTAVAYSFSMGYGSGYISSIAWLFGDGSGSSYASPDHTYASYGTYSVHLMLKGVHGEEATANATIILQAKAPGMPSASTVGGINGTQNVDIIQASGGLEDFIIILVSCGLAVAAVAVSYARRRKR